MAETNWQKFAKHFKNGGVFYALYRGIKYIKWRSMCARRGIDWKQFARNK
ncbi:MAG: hypothetical protein PHE18_02440 [Candidatus Omnitrophica bacterium]|nr:hypothetical protein [Candidatus Omnitrophota bacterium]MDD5552712.1 hypothetical protein [Candidatus Omnitrophota bacterium]